MRYRIEKSWQGGGWETVSAGHDHAEAQTKIKGHRAGAHPWVQYRRVRDRIEYMLLF